MLLKVVGNSKVIKGNNQRQHVLINSKELEIICFFSRLNSQKKVIISKKKKKKSEKFKNLSFPTGSKV